MSRIRCLLLLVLLTGSVLPPVISGQTVLKDPSEFLGYELGTRFTEHRDALDYFNYLHRNAGGMVRVDTVGETYEGRPLVIATLSSPENMSDLEGIRTRHLGSITDDSDSGKAIVWLSYNVHGDESVGLESALMTIYALLTERKELLENVVVRIDPCLNPDGRNRFAQWFRQYQNFREQPDRNSREHHQSWPGGRTNHYMFDLNRDWVWLTQQESEYRIREYQRWMPHLHVDFHEQDIDSPYYFAPASEPYHEIITAFQRDFQEEIARNHARYFDQNGWLYFTSERFDLLYPGYGDTYPMFNGAIGMTYEQGGSGEAGLSVITRAGDTLTLHERIRHHFTSGISTLEVASAKVERLNTEFRKYFREASGDYQAYALKGHPDKMRRLGRLLNAHGIEVSVSSGETGKGFSYGDQTNQSVSLDNQTWVLSGLQPKSRLIQALFEPRTVVADSLTYDITSWSLPYAYGLEAWALKEVPRHLTRLTEEEIGNWGVRNPRADLGSAELGYIADWASIADGSWLSALLREGIRLRRTSEPITYGGDTFGRGSIIYLERDQERSDARETLLKISREMTQSLHGLPSGRTQTGPDLGSSAIVPLDAPRVALLSGAPTRPQGFGEVWHFLERDLDYPVTVIDASYFDRVNLSSYQVLILPPGNYREFLDNEVRERLGRWIRSGGRLIALGKAVRYLAGKDPFDLIRKSYDGGKQNNRVSFDRIERQNLTYQITGALFPMEIDPTHPLAYGYGGEFVTLKLSGEAYELLPEGNVARLGDNGQPLTGFAGHKAQQHIVQSLSIGVQDIGSGEVVYFVDNPLFRGFWEEGKLFVVNALLGNL